MPKIPGLKENQRIQQQSPVQAVRANTDTGDALQQLGRTIQNTALTLDRLDKERGNANKAMVTQMFANKMELAAQNAHKALETGDSVSKDGSNYTSLFEGQVAGVFQEAQDMGGELGLVAHNAANRVFLNHRSKSVNKEVVLFNQHQFSQVEEFVTESSDIVAGDPSQYEEQLQTLTGTIDLLSVSPSNKAKMVEASKKELQASVMSSLYEGGSFSDAVKFVEKMGLKGSERKAMLQDVEKNRREFKRDGWNEDDRQWTIKNREKTELREDTMSNLFFQASSDDPVIRRTALTNGRKALGLSIIRPSDLNALTARDENVLESTSDMTALTYKKRLVEGKNLSTFRNDLMHEVGEETIKKDAAYRLMQESSIRKKKGSKVYTERNAIANRMMRAAFDADFFEKLGVDDARRHDRLSKLSSVENLASKLRQGGIDPVIAAYKAIRQVEPSNYMLQESAVFTGQGTSPEQVKKSINKDIKRLKDFYKKNKSKMSIPEKKKMLEELKSSERKRNFISGRLSTESEFKESQKEKK